MRLLLLAALTTLSAAQPVAAQSDLEILIGRTLRPSIVKIDVSSNTPRYDAAGTNICLSEGTGFAFNRRTVITADHVLAISPECGEPVIVIKSKRYAFQALATKTASKDDVAILGLDMDLPKDVCSARLRKSDSYNEKGFRLGIPATLNEANVLPVTTGAAGHPDFQPHVTLTPSSTEGGESGGPIVIDFKVVGILRQKHKNVSALAIMTSGVVLRELVQERKLQYDDPGCDPTKLDVFDVNNANVRATIKVNPSLEPEVQLKLGRYFPETYASQFRDRISSVTNNQVTLQNDRNSFSAQTTFDSFNNSVLFPRSGVSPSNQQRKAFVFGQLVSSKEAIERELWNKLVAEAERGGTWSTPELPK